MDLSPDQYDFEKQYSLYGIYVLFLRLCILSGSCIILFFLLHFWSNLGGVYSKVSVNMHSADPPGERLFQVHTRFKELDVLFRYVAPKTPKEKKIFLISTELEAYWTKMMLKIWSVPPSHGDQTVVILVRSPKSAYSAREQTGTVFSGV